LPPFGSHGSEPEIVLAVVLRELVAIKRAAVDRRRDLREANGPNRVSTVCSRFMVVDCTPPASSLQLSRHVNVLTTQWNSLRRRMVKMSRSNGAPDQAGALTRL